MHAEQWTGPVTHHGEGPVWDERLAALRCVDMLAGDVLTVRDGVVVDREGFGSVAAAWRPRRDGGFVVAVERGFVLVDRDGRRESIGPLWEPSGVRMNEGGCGPDGAFYCGSMHGDALEERGSLWRLAPDRSASVVLDRLTISNGLEFVPGTSFAYFIDTPTRRIDRLWFDDAGAVVDRTPFADLAGVQGRPDGLALDTDGGVWVALWGGGAVHRYDERGVLSEVVAIGVSQVSAVAFGGDDRRQLFATTSRYGLGPAEEPAAGSIFTAHVGVAGQSVGAYAG